MRVIRKTILDKIDVEVDKKPEDIIRIELNSKEFKELLSLLDFSCNSISKHSITDYRSYVVDKGICIQTHHRYE